MDGIQSKKINVKEIVAKIGLPTLIIAIFWIGLLIIGKTLGDINQ